TALASGELEEFQHRDLIAAADAYRKVSRANDPAVRAPALIAFARVLRQRGDRDGALRAYASLEQLGSVGVGGQPAALVALQGRSKVFEDAGDAARLHDASEQLAAAMNAGTWR